MRTLDNILDMGFGISEADPELYYAEAEVAVRDFTFIFIKRLKNSHINLHRTALDFGFPCRPAYPKKS